MEITLTDEEAQTLKELLAAYLPELRFETARTDGRELRHALVKREALCERLLDQLERKPRPA
jgi:hypothetical protein